MASPAPVASPREIDAFLESLVTGLRGETLRAQLAAKHPERTSEEIEDAIQTACKCFIDESDKINAPGQAYKWIRTVAHRSLNRERERLNRQIPVDLSHDGLEAIAADAPSPEQQLIDREDEIDLVALTETVASALPQRRREVLALYGAGYKRPEIAARLRVSDRTVKRDLLEILDQARTALARLAGGGCHRGESPIVRLACGLANPVEASQAQLHLARCPRCQQFHERLNLWREKVGALLPAPVSEHADSGMIERALHKSIETVGSLRQQVIDGGTQIKQQTATAYYRVADPIPLAGVRPGAVAAVVAGCLAVGTTYTCVEQGINPLTAIPGTEREAPERRTETPPPKTSSTDGTTTEQAPAPSPAPVAVEPVTTPEPTSTPTPPPPPPAEPVAPAPQPPPEQSFEPSSPAYSASASPSSAAATPAPVADGGGSSEFEP